MKKNILQSQYEPSFLIKQTNKQKRKQKTKTKQKQKHNFDRKTVFDKTSFRGH